MIRSIPPNTVMRSIYPTTGKTSSNTKPVYGGKPYKKPYKKPANRKIMSFNGVHAVEEVQLYLFDDIEKLEVMGNFPGICDALSFVIQVTDNELLIITKPDSERKYIATITLPEAYKYKISNVEVKNSIMTLLLEKTDYEDIPELESIFQECLKAFPELPDIELRVVMSRRSEDRDSLEGAMGKANGKKVVLLFVPKKLYGYWEALRPIIYHELSHYLDLNNPDKIFYERADEKSIKLWDMLKESKSLECDVVANH